MKRVTLILVMWTAVVPLFARQNTNDVITEIVVDSVGAEYRYQYAFGEQAYYTQEIKSEYKDGGWQLVSRKRMTYSDDGVLTSVRLERYEDGGWVSQQLASYAYTDDRLTATTYIDYLTGITTTLVSHFDVFTNTQVRTVEKSKDDVLLSRYQMSDKYDGSALKEQVITVDDKEVYRLEYDSSEPCVTTITQYEYAASAWQPTTRYRMFYDANTNQLAYQTVERYNPNAFVNKWEPKQYASWTAALSTGEVVYGKWQTMFWQSALRQQTSLMPTGEVSAIALQEPLYRVWRSVSDLTFDYSKTGVVTINYEPTFWGDSSALTTLMMTEDMEKQHISAKRGNKMTIYYNTPVITSLPLVERNQDILVEVAPNPSHGIYHLSLCTLGDYEWKVVSVSGVEVASSSWQKKSTIDITGCPNGIYLLVLEMGDLRYTHKLIKQ